MTLGKKIRLNRLLGPTGRLLGVTMDHSIARGIFEGLRDINAAVQNVLRGQPDSITLQRGSAANAFPSDAGATSLVLKATSYSPYHKTFDSPTAGVEEAIRLGADAIAVGVLVGGDEQARQVQHLAQIVTEADRFGMPVIGHIYPRGERLEGDRLSRENVAYAVRLGAELGVDIIKTEWPGSAEAFAEVVDYGRPARVVLAGGAQGRELSEYFSTTEEAIAAGAAGVAYGRFVWSHPHAGLLVQALHGLVHNGSTPEAALQVVAGTEVAHQ